jgi:spore germination protein (amino acid permease)
MENHLTNKLFIPLLLISFLGLGIPFNPHALEGGIGPNAYLVILIGCIITIIGLVGMQRIALKYPNQSLVRGADHLLGPIGKIGNFIFLSIVFLFIVIVTRRILDIMSAMVLFRTPYWVIHVAYLLLIMYIAVKGAETVGRLSSLCLLLVPIFIGLLCMGLKNVNYLNIHPVHIIRDLDALGKWWVWLVAFAPVWIVTFLKGNPNLRSGLKPMVWTVVIGTFILCATALVVSGVFGPNGVKRYEWPLLELMGTTGFASSYFFQSIATSTYIVIDLLFTVVTTAVFLTFLSTNLMDLLSLKEKRLKLVLLIITSGIFGVVFTPSVITVKRFENLLLEVGSIYIPLYIMLIWLVSQFRRKSDT